MTYSQSSYTPGQCTWYVAGADSWIPPGLGNAASWLTNAPAKGLRVGHSPQVGAVAVLEPGTPGLNVSVDGHVARVVGVSGDTVQLEDMNWNYRPFQVSNHSLAAGSISGYIYPPGGSVPTPTTGTATLLSASSDKSGIGALSQGSGAWWNPSTWFAPAPAYNPAYGGNPKAAGNAGGGTPDLLSPILGFLTKGGEVVIGVIAVLAGVFILVKHSQTGGQVINVATQTAKTGAKLL